jgi:hypothetical protein
MLLSKEMGIVLAMVLLIELGRFEKKVVKNWPLALAISETF